MIIPFDPREYAIRVPVKIVGPKKSAVIPMVPDTGASTSAISDYIANFVGYDTSSFETGDTVLTFDGVQTIQKLIAQRIELQEHSIDDFPIHCFPSNQVQGVSGVLGLDFLRGKRLTLDFRKGLLILE